MSTFFHWVQNSSRTKWSVFEVTHTHTRRVSLSLLFTRRKHAVVPLRGSVSHNKLFFCSSFSDEIKEGVCTRPRTGRSLPHRAERVSLSPAPLSVSHSLRLLADSASGEQPALQQDQLQTGHNVIRPIVIYMISLKHRDLNFQTRLLFRTHHRFSGLKRVSLQYIPLQWAQYDSVSPRPEHHKSLCKVFCFVLISLSFDSWLLQHPLDLDLKIIQNHWVFTLIYCNRLFIAISKNNCGLENSQTSHFIEHCCIVLGAGR